MKTNELALQKTREIYHQRNQPIMVSNAKVKQKKKREAKGQVSRH